MKRFIVTMAPKTKNRASFNFLIKVVEAENASEAIKKANFEFFVDYNKPIAKLCAFNQLFTM